MPAKNNVFNMKRVESEGLVNLLCYSGLAEVAKLTWVSLYHVTRIEGAINKSVELPRRQLNLPNLPSKSTFAIGGGGGTRMYSWNLPTGAAYKVL